MKVLGVIGTTALFLLLGATVPAFAQEAHPEDGAKPAEHEEPAKPAAKPEQTKAQKQEEQPKPAKQEEAKPQKQEQQQQQEKQQQQKAEASKQQEAKQQQVKPQQTEEKNQHEQQAKSQPEHPQGQFARNGQKDSAGHVYNESHFGPNHHARFESNGGRMYNGRREYSYGGYWFYAGSYPAWFYEQDVYFVMGADGLWYAVSYSNPSLMFQVNIG